MAAIVVLGGDQEKPPSFDTSHRQKRWMQVDAGFATCAVMPIRLRRLALVRRQARVRRDLKLDKAVPLAVSRPPECV